MTKILVTTQARIKSKECLEKILLIVLNFSVREDFIYLANGYPELNKKIMGHLREKIAAKIWTSFESALFRYIGNLLFLHRSYKKFEARRNDLYRMILEVYNLSHSMQKELKNLNEKSVKILSLFLSVILIS